MYDVFEGDIHDNTIGFILKLYLLNANQHYDWTSLLRLECVIEKTQHSSLVGSQVPLLEFQFPLGLRRSHLWPHKSFLYIPLTGPWVLLLQFQSPSRLRRLHLWPRKSLYIRLIGPANVSFKIPISTQIEEIALVAPQVPLVHLYSPLGKVLVPQGRYPHTLPQGLNGVWNWWVW
jgi:hypothetical protein